MASMDHTNIVRLFGISMGRKMMLVSQFVPLGSLLGFLRKHKERLNAKNMLTFSQQIAEVCVSGHLEISSLLQLSANTELQKIMYVVLCHPPPPPPPGNGLPGTEPHGTQ